MVLPPGRLGPPYLGESLAILRNPFAFLDERKARYGDVFKSRILGRNTVFLAGLEGAAAFYDRENVGRSDAHPYPITDLFGGTNFEMYDGPKHQQLKAAAITAFDADAFATYRPQFERLIGERLALWSQQPSFSATAELRKLAIECICLNLLGIEPGPGTEAICRDYAHVLKGIVSPPVPVPGTPYGKARAARDRLLATISRVIADHRRNPTADGLSRMLAAGPFTDEEAALEVHHIVIAGFIVYALMAEVLRRRPELDGADPLHVVLEAKRMVPLVPLAFGRAERDFACGGYDVPKGWRVHLALHLLNTDPAIWREPARFDPARFAPPRSEHESSPYAFIPQGLGPPTGHQCLGLEYSTVLVLAFVDALVAGYEWDLPPQDLAYRWNTIPPEPRDGMRVRLRPKPRPLEQP